VRRGHKESDNKQITFAVFAEPKNILTPTLRWYGLQFLAYAEGEKEKQ
jgi:hypothetical protein